MHEINKTNMTVMHKVLEREFDQSQEFSALFIVTSHVEKCFKIHLAGLPLSVMIGMKDCHYSGG